MSGYRDVYTLREENQILQYILTSPDIYSIKGDLFWKNMEMEMPTKRSWHSLKNHFRRTIMVRLNNSGYNLTPEQIALLKEVSKSTTDSAKPKPSSTRPKDGGFNIEDLPFSSDED